jgi:hypothetical protein
MALCIKLQCKGKVSMRQYIEMEFFFTGIKDRILLVMYQNLMPQRLQAKQFYSISNQFLRKSYV